MHISLSRWSVVQWYCTETVAFNDVLGFAYFDQISWLFVRQYHFCRPFLHTYFLFFVYHIFSSAPDGPTISNCPSSPINVVAATGASSGASKLDSTNIQWGRQYQCPGSQALTFQLVTRLSPMYIEVLHFPFLEVYALLLLLLLSLRK